MAGSATLSLISTLVKNPRSKLSIPSYSNDSRRFSRSLSMTSEDKIWSPLCDTCKDRFRCTFDASHPIIQVLCQPPERRPKLDLDEESGNVVLQTFQSSYVELHLGVAAGCPLCHILLKRSGNWNSQSARIRCQRWLVRSFDVRAATGKLLHICCKALPSIWYA